MKRQWNSVWGGAKKSTLSSNAHTEFSHIMDVIMDAKVHNFTIIQSVFFTIIIRLQSVLCFFS